MVNSESTKLSTPKRTWSRTLLYSAASAGLNIMSITVSTWLLYFYAPPPDSGRVQYMPAALVGLLLTLGSFWDAAIDPFIGHWSDTLRSRWGRRRPFLMFATPVAVVTLILLWTPPVQGVASLNAIYFTIVTVAYFTAFSLVGIPYDSTLPEMAPDTHDRVGLSYWKNVLGLIGVLIGSLVAAPLFESLGPVMMGIVVGAVGLVTIWMTLFGLRGVERPLGEPIGVWEGLWSTLRNQQFLVVFFSTLFVHLAYQMLLANLPYFVTLVIGQSEADVAIFQGVLILLMGLTGPLWTLASKHYSQRSLLNVAMAGMIVAAVVTFAVGMLSSSALFLQAMIGLIPFGVMLGGYFIIIYAMMGNVVDYDEMLTGRRREAIYYGTFSFANGLGISVGTLILPLLLEWFGYTKQNPMGVRVAFLAMAVAVGIGIAIFRGYRLGDTPEETRRNLEMPEV
ncbi:MAG TPA: MFS transporter [Chloroflexi bacterium]|nr:MFS transporter [Chloroflexota bacterium]